MPALSSPRELAHARAVARDVCGRGGGASAGERCEDLLLVLSELVGNAHRHGRPPVAYEVMLDGDDLLVTVEDHDPTPPPAVPEAAAETDEGGRGLLLVEALARRWGWEPLPGGKRVWARV